MRYFHTVRHLRPTQVAARVKFMLLKPRVDPRTSPPLRRVSGLYAAPIAPAPTLFASDVFRFLNVERRCATAADWQPQCAARLWAYNLHYFDDLNARESA